MIEPMLIVGAVTLIATLLISILYHIARISMLLRVIALHVNYVETKEALGED